MEGGQDDGVAVAGEVDAITTEPQGAEPVRRPRAARRVRKSASFSGNLTNNFQTDECSCNSHKVPRNNSLPHRTSTRRQCFEASLFSK
jgi:Tfp pilus assembly protein FimV